MMMNNNRRSKEAASSNTTGESRSRSSITRRSEKNNEDVSSFFVLSPSPTSALDPVSSIASHSPPPPPPPPPPPLSSSSISCLNDRSIDEEGYKDATMVIVDPPILSSMSPSSSNSDPNGCNKNDAVSKQEEEEEKETSTTFTSTPIKRKATTPPGCLSGQHEEPIDSTCSRRRNDVIPGLETLASGLKQEDNTGTTPLDSGGGGGGAAADYCNKRRGDASATSCPKRTRNDTDDDNSVTFRNKNGDDNDKVHTSGKNDEIAATADGCISNSSFGLLLLPTPQPPSKTITTASLVVSTRKAAEGGVLLAEQQQQQPGAPPGNKRHKRSSSSISHSSSSSSSLPRFSSLAPVGVATATATAAATASRREDSNEEDEDSSRRAFSSMLPPPPPQPLPSTVPPMALTTKVSATGAAEKTTTAAQPCKRDQSTTGTSSNLSPSPPVALSKRKPVPGVAVAAAVVVAATMGNNKDEYDDDDDDTRWGEFYYQAAFFKATQGHVNIPPDHVSDDDNSLLGKWVTEQRTKLSAYYHADTTDSNEAEQVPSNKLIQLQRIEKLRAIGFQFFNRWETFYMQLSMFYDLHRHTSVPLDFVCQGSMLELGQWVAQQNAELSTYLQSGTIANGQLPNITLDRIRRLVHIGLKTLADDGWDALYSKLAVFKMLHGHTKVPTDCVLFGWVARQRVELSAYLQAGKINAPVPEHVVLRIAKLIDIGFEFYNGFDAYLFQLASFKASFGHTKVPLDYICKDNMLPLGDWVVMQRKELSAHLQKGKENGELLPHIKMRIRKLVAMGFEFYGPWDTYYVQLCSLVALAGHVNIPADYVCRNSKLELGKWVANQKSQLCAVLYPKYINVPIPLFIQQRIRKLERIGFVFRDTSWEAQTSDRTLGILEHGQGLPHTRAYPTAHQKAQGHWF